MDKMECEQEKSYLHIAHDGVIHHQWPHQIDHWILSFPQILPDIKVAEIIIAIFKMYDGDVYTMQITIYLTEDSYLSFKKPNQLTWKVPLVVRST